MRLQLICIALALAGCSIPIEPKGYERATELCEKAGGLSWLSSTGANRSGTRFYTAVCKDETVVDFTI